MKKDAIDLEKIRESAQQEITAADSEHSLYQIKAKFLGKNGIVTDSLKKIGKLAVELRPLAGQQINKIKNELEKIVELKEKHLKQASVQAKINDASIDVTLPGIGASRGGLHPISLINTKIERIFSAMGFSVENGPEIEHEYYNFTALNIPSSHPARAMMDTFYISHDYVLRTHTSPVQIRTLKSGKLPLRMICPGKVYRCDSDLTHTPMFHQVEGMVIDKDISFADLKGCIDFFITTFFAKDVKTRFRASFFPFTEPSAEVDVQCVKCNGKGCRVCSSTGWLEILGCGMVNPLVLQMSDIDSEKYSGFAFGVGLERLAMLEFEIDDIRAFYENDVNFLNQFNPL